MNDIEMQHINSMFEEGTDGKTMEDYFDQIQIMITGQMTKDELKSEFKKKYPDETDWSF